MVPTPNERRPDFTNKLKEPILTKLAALKLGQALQLGQQYLLLVWRQLVENLGDIRKRDVLSRWH
jgi:hypothetical protein